MGSLIDEYRKKRYQGQILGALQHYKGIRGRTSKDTEKK